MASPGAFEHFCSPEEYRAGRQEDVYRGLFARIGTVLPDKGRFFLQTMVFGRNMIPADRIGINAPRESDAWYLALIGRQFPGSFLPFGQEQIVRSAEPHFRLVSSTSGRLDYIETIREWRKRFAGPSVGKMLLSESVEAAAGPAASSSRSREIPVGRYCFAPKGVVPGLATAFHAKGARSASPGFTGWGQREPYGHDVLPPEGVAGRWPLR